MSGSAATLPHVPVSHLPLRVLGDDRLIELAAAGSRRAFAALYERHHRALYRYCRSIVRSEHDAHDVLQTTMTRALVALAKGPPAAPVRPWLFRIAHNEAVSLLRARRPTAELDEADQLAGASVERSAEERARLALLVADLQDLPERQRSALVMRELSGLSHAEIATALDVSVAGAKQAIFEARLGLQELAKGREMDCAEIQRIISDADGRKLRRRPVRGHLRSCDDCRALRDAIARRRGDLAALAPPLPGAAAAGLLARLLGDAGGHAGGGGASATATATVGKVASVGLTGKLAAGAVVLATIGAGAPKIVEEAVPHPDARRSGPTVQVGPASAPVAAPVASGTTSGLTTVGARPSGVRTTVASRSRPARRASNRGRPTAPGARGRSHASNGRGANPPGSRRPPWAGAPARAKVPTRVRSRPAPPTTRATPSAPTVRAVPTRPAAARRAMPAPAAVDRDPARAVPPATGRPSATSGAAPSPGASARPPR